jgi:hypothetical protein
MVHGQVDLLGENGASQDQKTLPHPLMIIGLTWQYFEKKRQKHK